MDRDLAAFSGHFLTDYDIFALERGCVKTESDVDDSVYELVVSGSCRSKYYSIILDLSLALVAGICFYDRRLDRLCTIPVFSSVFYLKLTGDHIFLAGLETLESYFVVDELLVLRESSLFVNSLCDCFFFCSDISCICCDIENSYSLISVIDIFMICYEFIFICLVPKVQLLVNNERIVFHDSGIKCKLNIYFSVRCSDVVSLSCRCDRLFCRLGHYRTHQRIFLPGDQVDIIHGILESCCLTFYDDLFVCIRV